VKFCVLLLVHAPVPADQFHHVALSFGVDTVNDTGKLNTPLVTFAVNPDAVWLFTVM
jgi:hypothetical protein